MDYSCVLTEVNEIFKYLDKNILEKLPLKLRAEILTKKNNEYQFKYDTSKQLDEQNIMPQTRSLFSALYLMYCCTPEEKKELLKICEENEEKYKEEVSINFPNENNKITENTNLTITSKEKWYKKIFNKIKKIIFRTKEK